MHFERVDMNDPENSGTTLWKSEGRRLLITALAFLSILSITLICAIVYILERQPSTVCLSPACIKTASMILTSMNASVDPCEDFYEYACGNWIKEHPIPDDAPSVSNFENLGQSLELALKGP